MTTNLVEGGSIILSDSEELAVKVAAKAIHRWKHPSLRMDNQCQWDARWACESVLTANECMCGAFVPDSADMESCGNCGQLAPRERLPLVPGTGKEPSE